LTDRLDRAMASRGLAASRERAQGLIEAGMVLVDGSPAEKASQRVEESTEIAVTGEALPYVGRGGPKMEAALRKFRVNVRDLNCLDVGASTGGFTDCLLQRGAAKVVAIDVGHGQLAAALAANPRIELREGVNARYLLPVQFDQPFDLAVVDVSFISLTLVLPAIVRLIRPGGHILALVKPEFEAGRAAVGPRGIVRSAAARLKALEKVSKFAGAELGLDVRGSVPSLFGGGGNKEYFLYLRRAVEVTTTLATHPNNPADCE